MTETDMLALLFNGAALVIWAVLIMGGLGALVAHEWRRHCRRNRARRLERLRARNAAYREANAAWRRKRGL